MKRVSETGGEYLADLAERAQRSRAHRSHQFTGLEIAVILRDWEHRSLYMKLAKAGDPDRLISLAKTVAERRDVRNRGAYFMRIIREESAVKYPPRFVTHQGEAGETGTNVQKPKRRKTIRRRT